jgi:hypothetical protein
VSTVQPTLFELLEPETAASAKRRGIAQTAKANAAFLAAARALAIETARREGSVTADTLRRECARRGLRPRGSNCWGAVFARCPGLRWSGEFVVSQQPQGHSNWIRRWVLA